MHVDRSIYYGRDGQPISLDEAMKLFAKPEARRVAYDEIGKAVLSTVHLVIDHNYTLDGDPIIFETLVMGGPRDSEMRRYATEDAARAGHAELLAELKLTEGVTLEEIELELAGLLA